MQDALVLKKNPDIVSRTIEDETILMPIYKTSSEINCIYTLNKTAARIWELIDGKNNIKYITEELIREYDESFDHVFSDVIEFVKNMSKLGLIK